MEFPLFVSQTYYAKLHNVSQVKNVILHLKKIWYRMRVERFMEYETEGGENLIQRWYNAQDPAVQAGFDYVLQEILATADVSDCEIFKSMKRKHIGLWEVVFEIPDERGKRRQLRPVGFWNYGEREFILVDACRKSGRFTEPQGVFDRALDVQLAFFFQGRGTIREHHI